MPYTISKAKHEDLPALNEISVESKMHWNYPNEWLEKWKDTLTITSQYLEENYVYKIENDQILGFCGIEKKEKYFEVAHLWIKPGYIGKGLGKKLLHESLGKVVPKGFEVRVEADPNAEPFYASQGFVTFDKVESYPTGRFLPLMKMIFV